LTTGKVRAKVDQETNHSHKNKMKIQSILENLIFGNITDAKKGAKRVSEKKIADWAIENLGYDCQEGRVTALFLKGKIDYQNYCDGMAWI
jgi:hypothetical protein